MKSTFAINALREKCKWTWSGNECKSKKMIEKKVKIGDSETVEAETFCGDDINGRS